MKPLSVPRTTGPHKRMPPKPRTYPKRRPKPPYTEDYASLAALAEMAQLRREDYGA